jgi:uncharacterized protein (DUF302 family)
MTYHFSKTVDMPFDAAVTAVTAALQKHGFGVLTQIDVKETLGKKIGVDFRPYLILGACNPKLAYEALTLEDKIGTMLPCNVVVQQHDPGVVEISAVDPVASMASIENPGLGAVSGKVRELLRQVVADVA